MFGHKKSSHNEKEVTFVPFQSLTVIEKVKDDKLTTKQIKYNQRILKNWGKKEESKLKDAWISVGYKEDYLPADAIKAVLDKISHIEYY